MPAMTALRLDAVLSVKIIHGIEPGAEIGIRAPRSSHPTKEGTPNLKPVAERQFQLNRKFNLRCKFSLRL